MQRRLTTAESEKLTKARDAVQSILLPSHSDADHFWREVVKSLTDKIKHGTNDGKPWVEPELTDEDACVRPRLLVMVRDSQNLPWEGPFYYLAMTGGKLKFVAFDGSKGVMCWPYARRATLEEIKEAGL